MPPDALVIVSGLRHTALDQARAVLVESVARAEYAASAEQAARAAIALEMQAALELSADDATVDTFAAWLPQGRAALTRAFQHLEAAQDDVTQARAALNLARAAAEAVDQLIEARRVAAVKELQRKQQIELDSLGHRRSIGLIADDRSH